MRKSIYGIGAAIVLAVALAIFGAQPQKEIAVIVPLQHTAMDAIVAGLKRELGDSFPIHVYNAQGDSALQAAILQQLELTDPLAVLPIGTAATQMTLQRLPKTPVVHLAAKFLEEDRAPDQCVCGVLDELPPEKALHLAALLIPKLKKVTLIHSASEKTFPEAAAFEAEARRMGIEVQRLMIQAQSELYTVSQHVATDSQLIALLKDHMVVAGITTLVECAERLDIPLMAADEGSVQGGASFAAGVPEAAIGAAGGRLIHRLIAGEALQDLPIDCVEDIHLFYRRENPSGLDYEAAAHSLGYTLTEVEG